MAIPHKIADDEKITKETGFLDDLVALMIEDGLAAAASPVACCVLAVACCVLGVQVVIAGDPIRSRTNSSPSGGRAARSVCAIQPANAANSLRSARWMEHGIMQFAEPIFALFRHFQSAPSAWALAKRLHFFR